VLGDEQAQNWEKAQTTQKTQKLTKLGKERKIIRFAGELLETG